MSWEYKWVKCQHKNHEWNAKYDKGGEQKGWQCRSCGYSVCEYCERDPKWAPCPNCGAR